MIEGLRKGGGNAQGYRGYDLRLASHFKKMFRFIVNLFWFSGPFCNAILLDVLPLAFV